MIFGKLIVLSLAIHFISDPFKFLVLILIKTGSIIFEFENHFFFLFALVLFFIFDRKSNLVLFVSVF